MKLIYKQEFYDIKSACIPLKIELGLGFLEKVYENGVKLLAFYLKTTNLYELKRTQVDVIICKLSQNARDIIKLNRYTLHSLQCNIT